MTPDSAWSDCERTLDALREQGADQWQPVAFHYLESLARRMSDQAPQVRRILEGKWARALAAYQTHAPTHSAITESAAQPQNPTLLGQLVQAMAQPTTAPAASAWARTTGPRTELKSVHQFRNTWSKLSAQKQVTQALGQAPKNAGPINSHMLVLRSLELMRNISPDYLNRFMSYADTLLCLDQSSLSANPTPAKPIASAKPRSKTPARP